MRAASDPRLRGIADRATGDTAAALIEIDRLRKDPQLGHPGLLNRQLEIFRATTERVRLVEAFAVSPIERFDADDIWLTDALAGLAAEVGWPPPYPPVVAHEGEYLSRFDYPVVYARVRARTLLVLPALVHELGHHLYRREAQRFVAIADSARIQIEALIGHDGLQRPSANDVIRRWKGSWLEEFVCDCLAVGVLGGAYLHHLVSHVAVRDTRPYQPFAGDSDSTHPAMAARLEAIARVLPAHGAGATATADTWTAILKSMSPSPTLYRPSYPDAALDDLTSIVASAGSALGLRLGFGSAPSGTWVNRITKAWDQLLVDPDAYDQWELGELKDDRVVN